MNAQLRVRVVKITPEMAAEMLKRNTHNRKLRPAQIAKLALAMTRGEWYLNGETITFDYNDTIINGQHRLWAVVKSGVTIETLVVEGLDPKAQETVDFNVTRNTAGLFELRGETNVSKKASTSTRFCRLVKYGLRVACTSITTHYPVTANEAVACYDENQELLDELMTRTRALKGVGIPESLAAILVYSFDQIDYDDSHAFWHRLKTGENLAPGDPILALRRVLEKNTQGNARLDQKYIAAITIKAWNSWRRGDQVSMMVWKAGGARPEKFPEPV